MNIPGEVVGLVEAGHHRNIENRSHDENDESERWMYVRMRPKVNVCGQKVEDGCMRVGAPTPDLRNDLQDDPLHLRHSPLVYSVFVWFAVPATRPVGRQRTRTARRAVTVLMYPSNAG